MPLNTCLNLQAVKLATTGLKRLQEKPLVPMGPNIIIQFHIEGRELTKITRDFKRTVREIVELPPIQKFSP